MTPKRLSQSDFDTRQKLLPATTHKVMEVTKIVVGKLIKFISNDPKAHLCKPFWQLETKILPVCWWYKSVSFHDIAMFSNNYAPIYPL